MENMFKKITQSERKIISCINLLQIAKNYCEYNYDKGNEIVSLGTLLEVILEEENELLNNIDDIAALQL